MSIRGISPLYIQKYILTGKILPDGTLTDVKETTKYGLYFLPYDDSPTSLFHHWQLVVISEVVFHLLVVELMPIPPMFFHTIGIMFLFLYYAAKCLQQGRSDLWASDAESDPKYFESPSDFDEIYSEDNEK